MTFSILFVLSALLVANRKTQIPESGLIPIGIVMIALVSLSSSLSDHIDSVLPDSAPNPEMLTALAMFRYIARPCIILLELLIIVPDIKHKFAVSIPAVINTVVYLATPFFGDYIFLYKGDSFRRDILGYTIYVVLIFYVVLLFFCSVQRFGRQSTGKNIIVACLVFLAVITAVLELNNVETDFVSPITALSILTYYIYLATIYQQEMKESVTEKELRIEQDTLKLLRAQIQPHFIYNTLGVIRSLIRQDQRVAIRCIDNFADYLKGHIRAIQSDELIPFEKEMENVQAYLSLVMADHDLDVRIDYDLAEKDFEIPALTLEPIVENAIKHGISGKDGFVEIKSFSRPDSFVITVTDSGSKPDRLTEREQERLGVGLENTRRRLEMQCGGNLVLNEVSGGTEAEITIPKEREKQI
jgi:sensor histidine kinase YesM